MWKPDACIYHFPCDDGFGAAWAVHRRWPDIEFMPTNYGQEFDVDKCAGKNVLIVDFSFDYETCCRLSFKARSVVILDHHKTAKEALQRLPPLTRLTQDGLTEAFQINCAQNTPEICAHFDMDRSGAALAWEFCHPNKNPPELIQYIEDRDLWRFKHPVTRPLSLYLRSFEYDFDVWTEIMETFEVNKGIALQMGAAIERFYDRKIAEMVPTATMQRIGGYKVPLAHAPYAFASDLANALLKAHPAAPFAAVAIDAHGGRSYSLRSEDSRVDVGRVAESMGGGGHRNAAGFRS